MNSLRVTETNPDPQLNSSTFRTAELNRKPIIAGSEVVPITSLSRGVNYIHLDRVTVGQTLGIDVEARSDDGVVPQPGITAFARELGVSSKDLIMPRLNMHTTNVLVVNGLQDLAFHSEEGRQTGYSFDTDSEYYDALIVKRTPETAGKVLAITGADCTSLVGKAKLADGTDIMIGIHAGRKGCLGGIIENTAEELLEQGIVPGSLRLVIGPGGQALEYPVNLLEKEAEHNIHEFTKGLWQESLTTQYSTRDTRELTAIYDNHADAVRRALVAFDGLFSANGLMIIDANTVTSEGLSSYRASSIAGKQGDSVTANKKLGRNALFTRFY